MGLRQFLPGPVRALLRPLKRRLGFGGPARSEARLELEETILPWLAAHEEVRRVLFVGTAPYTKEYGRFFDGCDFHATIAVDPAMNRYGAKRHIVDSFANLDRHLQPESLDLVVCNGVVGHGLDHRDEIESAIERCANALRPGGLLLYGWNDVKQHRPVRPKEIAALRRFRPFVFPPFGQWRHETGSALRHVFDFYERSTN